MTNATESALVLRLDRLERKVRWWKVVGSVAAGAVGAILLLGATGAKVADEIRAKRVVIVDDSGKPRILLGKGIFEAYEVSLVNTKGIKAAQLYLAEFAPPATPATQAGLALYDGKGNQHISLAMYSEPDFDRAKLLLRGESRVGFESRETRTPLLLEATPEHVELEVTSDRGKKPEEVSRSTASFSLRTDRVGTSFWLDGKKSSLSFSNYAGSPPVGALAKERGRFSLGMYDGRPGVQLGDSVLGFPGLVLGDTSLIQSRTGVVEQRPGASLLMFDKDGNVIWKAP